MQTFESWWQSQGLRHQVANEHAYIIWTASRKAALEEAREIVLEVDNKEWFKNQSMTCQAIADAIGERMNI